MENSNNTHKKILQYCIENKPFQNELLLHLQKEDYYFNTEEVGNYAVRIMKRRKRAMSMNARYKKTVDNLLVFIEENTSLRAVEFIFYKCAFYLFFDTDIQYFIGGYKNSNLSIEKMLRLNQEYAKNNLALMNYECYKKIKI